MTKILFEKETIYKRTSSIIKDSINKTLSEKDKLVLGLPGGRSVSDILQCLKMENIDWKRVHIFMVDERLVPIDNKDSNFRLIKHELSRVVPEKNLHPFLFNKNKPDFGLEQYKKEIKDFGGIFDIVLLSSGEDGHIGSLFPNHSSIFDESDYYILVENSPKSPRKRVSISKKFLLNSSIGVLLFVGDMKREAYLKFLNESTDISTCPAKLVTQLPESYTLTNIKFDEDLE